jgi:hypothetical protein
MHACTHAHAHTQVVCSLTVTQSPVPAEWAAAIRVLPADATEPGGGGGGGGGGTDWPDLALAETAGPQEVRLPVPVAGAGLRVTVRAARPGADTGVGLAGLRCWGYEFGRAEVW